MSTEIKSALPIGIFDSGVGGLTVYRALHQRLPGEHFIYLGDTARVPYGTKSLETVERYAIENSLFLYGLGIKMLVVACNTASALALPKIRELIGLDVIGVIGPGSRLAARLTTDLQSPRIGVIGTEATIASGAYEEAIKRANPKAEIMQIACPLFVPLAEEGWTHEPETVSIAKRYLGEMADWQPSAVVLGCTHYPILKDVIGEILGPKVTLVDSGQAAAEEVAELLDARELARAAESNGRELCDDLDHFYVTDAAGRFARVAERFLGSPPKKLEAIDIESVIKCFPQN
jgi:glutamate racemase